MKTILFALIIVLFSLMACKGDGSYYGQEPYRDTIPPVIKILGSAVDTTFLYTEYRDPGAEVYDDWDGVRSCNDATLVTEVDNKVNTRIPGIYFIYYSAADTLGNPLATATRTVHVKQNNSTFLNGNYNVACTCTASADASSQGTVTSGQYTVVITSSNERSGFNVSALELGSEALVPSMYLNGDKIQVNYWSLDLQQMGERAGTGTVSATKNSFTVETTAYPYQPLLTYRCKNVFTKQVRIN